MLARSRVRSRRKGAALVEAAVVLPLFLMLLLGGALLGTRVSQNQERGALAQGLARWASIQDPATLTPQQLLDNVPASNAAGFDPTKMDVTTTRINGYTTLVTIRYPKSADDAPAAFTIARRFWNPY